MKKKTIGLISIGILIVVSSLIVMYVYGFSNSKNAEEQQGKEEQQVKKEQQVKFEINGEQIAEIRQQIATGENTIVYFHQEDCKYCQMANPILDSLSEELEIKINKLDLKYNPVGWEEFEIQGTPTLILFNGGKEVTRVTGLIEKENYKEWLLFANEYNPEIYEEQK